MTPARPLARNSIICWVDAWFAQLEGTLATAEPDLPARRVELERTHILTLNAPS